MSELCGICEKKVLSNQNALQCDSCDRWFHCGCEKVAVSDYKLLKDCECAKWHCKKCDLNYKETKRENIFLKSELQRVKDENEILKQKLLALEEKIDAKQSFSKDDIEKIVEESIQEHAEKEKRKLNVMVFNLPEAQSEDWEVRQKYDNQTVSNIIEGGLGITPVDTIQQIVRVGKRTNDSRDNRNPRPLIVKMNNMKDKWNIIKNAKKLRNGKNMGWRNVYLVPDLTQKEREKEKKLREELNKRRDRGEKGWQIKRGELTQKIVQEQEEMQAIQPESVNDVQAQPNMQIMQTVQANMGMISVGNFQ